MKYVLSNIVAFVVSVVFLYYLFNTPSFIPQDSVGELNWLNIAVLVFSLFVAIYSLLALLSFGLLSLFRKKIGTRVARFISFKIGIIFSIGIVLVFFLNFFHVLNWIWGLSILVVVLLASFVI